jgi:hypothetical protein
MEIARSAPLVFSTRTEVDVVLLDETGSVVCEVTSAELTILVPAAVAAATVTTYVNVPGVLIFSVPVAEHRTSPVPPTAGVVPHAHPAGGVIEENVVLGGVC